MKKIALVLAVVLMLSLVLVSCGGTEESKAPATSDVVSTETSKEVSEEESEEESEEVSEEESNNLILLKKGADKLTEEVNKILAKALQMAGK